MTPSSGRGCDFPLQDDKLTSQLLQDAAAEPDTETVWPQWFADSSPGRDIEVQAWYQGGISMWISPTGATFEIAYFDRGPMIRRVLVLGGDGRDIGIRYIYGSEICTRLDVFELTQLSFLPERIDSAKAVRVQS